MSANDACIQRTYFGGQEILTFAEWAETCVQDADLAIEVAKSMLAAPQFEREWNDGDHPSYYEKFFITDANLFREQMHAYDEGTR